MRPFVVAGAVGSLLVVAVAASTPFLPIDGDGRPATEEWGTSNPLRPDTDGDGLSDTVEEALGTDPTDADTDGDGLTDERELALGAHPLVPDTDHDGLLDGREVDLGTNLSAVDTDGDGLPDAAEVRATETLSDASPTRMDVFVDVHGLSECRSDRPSGIDRTKRAFAEAPVENVDGSTGITLHVVNHSSLGDHALSGYRGVWFSPDGPTGEQFGRAGDDHARVRCGSGDTFMHELGHLLGLDSRVHEAIDSYAVPPFRYPSVMNYNAPQEYYEYTDGTASRDDLSGVYEPHHIGPNETQEVFDEWAYLERHMAAPPVTGLPPYSTGDERRATLPDPESAPSRPSRPDPYRVPGGQFTTLVLVVAPALLGAALDGRRR